MKGRGSSDVCQVSIGPTRASRLDPSLDSECSVLPTDIQDLNSNAIAPQYFNSNLQYPGKCVPTVGCAKTQESICLKSSICQRPMWTSGLLFSVEQTADYSLSSCMQHTQGQDKENVESFSSSGSVMRLPVSTPGLVQQLLWFIQFFSSVSTARFIGIITKQSFSKSQYLEKE